MLYRRGRYVNVVESGAGVARMLARPTWSSSGRSRVLNCTLAAPDVHDQG